MDSKVQQTVLTAGGAAHSNSSKKKKKHKKKTPQQTVFPDATSTSTSTSRKAPLVDLQHTAQPTTNTTTTTTNTSTNLFALELEESERAQDDSLEAADASMEATAGSSSSTTTRTTARRKASGDMLEPPVKMDSLLAQTPPPNASSKSEVVWLFLCFAGIMASFVIYGILMEYTTSGGRELHELSFLFVTSSLYTVTAAAGRYVRAETPTTIPPARFAILGLTSMGSTFCSVRSLRYVIYPIQVLAKSCKPVPVMLIGAAMGKQYSASKYVNVAMIVSGVALFMVGGEKSGDKHTAGGDGDDNMSASSQLFGIVLLFISLCFDGGTGAYEDKLMSVHSVQAFDLMYNIQLGKTILAGVSLLVLNQVHVFVQMCADMGFLLVALGLSGAMGQVFIFVTIAKFGALTCSIIGLARKITTLVFSIWYFGHHLNMTQSLGLMISVGAMVLNFMGKSKKGGSGGGHDPPPSEERPTHDQLPEDMQKMLSEYQDEPDEEEGHVELSATTSRK